VAARALAAYGRLPLRFEENRGQAAGDVRFLSRGMGYTVLLTADEAVLALSSKHGTASKNAVVRLRLAGVRRRGAQLAEGCLGDRLEPGCPLRVVLGGLDLGECQQRIALLVREVAVMPSPEDRRA